MQVESIAIADLSNDPANARKHGQKNIDTIVASLRRFGQQKPIVIDSSGIVRAGNGTLEAAKVLGWDSIDAIRTELKGSEATAYAIADNRTAELAEWDDDVLAATLQGLVTDDEDLLAAAGFDEDELAALLDEMDAGNENESTTERSLQLKPDMEYVLIVCDSPEEWIEMQEKLKLKQVRRGGYKKGSAFDSVGTERVLAWSELAERVNSDNSDTV